MKSTKVSGIVLIVLGVLALIYGSFTYTHKSNEAKIGSLRLSVTQKKRVNIPIWTGVGAVAAGAVLLLVRETPEDVAPSTPKIA
ncbi:MAG: hypothetical protein ACYDDA_07135 [Acidiferrobacteraceae bacterium]